MRNVVDVFSAVIFGMLITWSLEYSGYETNLFETLVIYFLLLTQISLIGLSKKLEEME